MFSLYDINWSNLSQIEKWTFFGIFMIMIIVGIIDYFYQKHKKTKSDKI